MKQLLAKLFFKLNGWKAVGLYDYPKKSLIISAPHTSNWDFFIGRSYAYLLGIKPKYLIKSEFFVPVLGTLFRWNGGIPVYRNAKNNVVDQVAEMFNNNDELLIGIAPEGTRSRVDKWKTGFYYIALKAKVPILLLKMDYEKKEVGIICDLIPGGNFEKDMLFIQEKFKDVKGKIPENYNPEII